jgi:chorismate mutase
MGTGTTPNTLSEAMRRVDDGLKRPRIQFVPDPDIADKLERDLSNKSELEESVKDLTSKSIVQLNQRRADAINAVARAKVHANATTHVFSAHDASTAYQIAELLNTIADQAPAQLDPAFAEKPIPSKKINDKIDRAIAENIEPKEPDTETQPE